MERDALDNPAPADVPVAKCRHAIAVIGMSGRFPGARNLDQFWQNLVHGIESIRVFSPEELLAAGVPPHLLRRPDYVPAAPTLDEIDLFDAKFFGMTPREAMVTDPQHRLFLECAWEALERAGYCGESYDGSIGVFAGSGPSMSSYVTSETHINPSLFGPSGSREHIGNDKDYLCTRVSYKLNLRGPSINIQTACSTSLVALHLACQSLLLGESDIALAGGVTLRIPQVKGYLWRELGLASHDGHCRTFDANATGTVFGSGVGVVVLKRLSAAIADGDVIHAVIRGSAVNNDGGAKISYWGSAAEGQSAAMVEALAIAEVPPDSVTMVEAHGTATTLGDPVEVQALTRAFQTPHSPTEYCAIGSVKTNIGHLDSASGIAGFLKAVLALKHRTIPASLHFDTPNPRIGFPNTPFFVNTQRRAWESPDRPRRAAVNSLGIGGTNAFLVLEEAPTPAHAPTNTPAVAVSESASQLLVLTARSAPALRALAERYVTHFHQHPHQQLADVAFTAATGRLMCAHRLAIVAHSVAETVELLTGFLSSVSDANVSCGEVPRGGAPKLAIALPDLTNQPLDMFRVLYESDQVFRRRVDQWAKRILALTGTLLMPHVVPSPGPEDTSLWTAPPLTAPPLAAIALQASVAEWIRDWGIKWSAVTGQGTGHGAALVLSGRHTIDEIIQLASHATTASTVLGALPLLPETPIDTIWELGSTAVGESYGRAEFSGRRLTGVPHGECLRRHLLRQLGTLFAAGLSVPWRAFYEGSARRRRVELPTYPFERKRYWIEPVAATLTDRYGPPDVSLHEAVHPRLGRRIQVAARPDEWVFEMHLDATHPLLAVAGSAAGARAASEDTLRDLAMEAIRTAHGDTSNACEQAILHERLELKEDEYRVLQICIQPRGDAALVVAIYGRPYSPDHISDMKWSLHFTATASL
jgi:acyl transferase domain-containing protein